MSQGTFDVSRGPLRRRALLSVCLATIAVAGVSCGGDGPTEPTPSSEPNPTPSLASISPAAVRVGSGSLHLQAQGSDFVRASVVRWNGVDRPTSFVSTTQLTADIPSADLASAGPASVTVVSPGPGGGTSEARTFVVQYPPPSLASIAPTSAAVGSPAITLTVTGQNFAPTSIVRWNGFDRPTTFVSATKLTAEIAASDFAIAVNRDVTVYTPDADGGASAAIAFAVLNPAPVATAISPTSVNAFSPSFVVTVTGSAFTVSSVGRVNGADRPTTFVSANELRVQVLSGDIATPGSSVPIAVYTRGPGGGTSAARSLSVYNPTPMLTSIGPAMSPAGASGVTLDVTGDHFVAGAVVRWNGADRPTTFVSATKLTATIGAADLASTGSAQVTVRNPTPGGGTSGARTFVVVASSFSIASQLVLDLPTRDIIADPVRRRLYVSVPGTGGARANTVTAIDPATGAILFSVAVGSEPAGLAIADDGSYLYAALDGESAVRRVDLVAQSPDIEFMLGDSYWGPEKAGDMVVLPGMPRSIAIARVRPQVSPPHGGVAIFDDGVMRPKLTQEHTGSDVLEPSGSASTLYGFNNKS
ncbi:MAG TPA: hypothetical protein VFJ74_02010, partial [Gemmatimonadaceae bacterium]|nr:hypothetical protein [Gemmatimonadaceae bacterium]